MALTVTMPQLGESVTEGTLSQWLKQPGEPVDRYEAIAEVVTDKVNAEIPSPSAGRMGEHMVEEGAVVAVGQPICTIESADGGNGTAQPEARVEEPAAAQGAQGAQGTQGAIDTGAGAPPSQRAGAAAPGSAPPPPEATPPAPPREPAAP